MNGSRVMNNIEIITGDALVEMGKIKADSVDLIVADPPYNLGKDYGNNHDIQGFDEYLLFSKNWLATPIEFSNLRELFMCSWDSSSYLIFIIF